VNAHLNRRAVLRAAALTVAGAGLGGALSGCGREPRPGGDIVFWGASGDSAPPQQKIVDAFTAEHPGVRITVNEVPVSSTDAATSVITAVRGGTAPDVWWVDRFTVVQYAALGLLEPLTPLLAQYDGTDQAEFTSAWLDFAIAEVTYDGQIYALPTETDSRGLFYNKTVLREVGIDPDELDPRNPPVTFDRLAEMSRAVTTVDAAGNYTRMGFVPWGDQASAYAWSLGLGARYFDPSRCAVDMLAPPVLEAYEQMARWRDELGYDRVDVFKATYAPPKSPPSQNLFVNGRRVFVADAPYFVSRIERYAPDLDWGVTHLPVWNAGDPPYTWSGGFALAAPRGSSLSPEVWEFLKYFAGPRGQEVFLREVSRVPSERSVLATAAQTVPSIAYFVDEMAHSQSRPPLPIGQLWWDTSLAAQASVLHGTATPREALERAQARLAPQMQLHCPYSPL